MEDLLTRAQWRNKLRKPVKHAIPTEDGFYPKTQTKPITGKQERALVQFSRIFLHGHDRHQILHYPYFCPKNTIQGERVHFNPRDHFRGKTVQGVYPKYYTRFVRFDVDAHSSEKKEWCIKTHSALCNFLKANNYTFFQQIGTTGTNIFVVFDQERKIPQAEALCREILQHVPGSDGVEYFPHGQRNCTLPLRFDRITILDKPIGLENYTYRGEIKSRVSVVRLIDWLADPEREYADPDDELLFSTINPPITPNKPHNSGNSQNQGGFVGKQKWVFLRNYVAFWNGDNPPDTMQPWLGMSRRFLEAYGYTTEEINSILVRFVEELPDKAFSDQLSSDERGFYKKLRRDTVKMAGNRYQADIKGSNEIFEKVVARCNVLGFDPGDKDTWHSATRSKADAFAWNHTPFETFLGFKEDHLKLIQEHLLPIYGKRTSLDEAIAVTSVLLDFVANSDSGEIGKDIWSLVLKGFPWREVSSTSIIRSLWEKIPDYPLKKDAKVSALINKLIEIGFLTVKANYWKQGHRARSYVLGPAVHKLWDKNLKPTLLESLEPEEEAIEKPEDWELMNFCLKKLLQNDTWKPKAKIAPVVKLVEEEPWQMTDHELERLRLAIA